MSSSVPLPQTSVFVTKGFVDIESEARAAGWHLPPDLESAHKSRQTEWLASRLCLSEAFRARGVHLDPQQIRFIDHQQIEDEAGFRFSFSHTRDCAGCWLLDARAESQNASLRIGLDIEPVNRKLTAAAGARLNLLGETLSDLERWCLREAIFKALPASEQARFTGSKIEATRGEFTIQPLARRGFFHLERGVTLLSAFAWSNG